MSKRVVFVCTGNICRSPMAEYLFRARVGERPDILISSAGIMAGYGAPASRFAVQALEELGVDASAHRSQPVTPDMVRNADLLVVMTTQHRDILLAHHPEAESRIFTLKSFNPEADGADVMDPIGLSLDVYRHVRDEIAAALDGLELHLRLTKADGEEQRK